MNLLFCPKRNLFSSTSQKQRIDFEMERINQLKIDMDGRPLIVSWPQDVMDESTPIVWKPLVTSDEAIITL